MAALGLALAGCPATSEEVRPPEDQLFFPVGLSVDPAEEVLFAVNANSELRYDSGTVMGFDLDRVDEIADAWLADGTIPEDPAGCESCCEVDPDARTTLICNERIARIEGSVVRIGNFATKVAIQQLDDGNYRLFVPVRGDPSITYIDFDTESREMSCGGSGRVPLCDEDHRLDQLAGDPDLSSLSDEPWGIHVDSENGYAVVTHLTTGIVSLVDAPPGGAPPVIAEAVGGLFAQSSSGARGATGVAGRRPGSPGNLVYVTSRAESRVQVLSVYRPGRLPRLASSEFFFLDRLLPSADARGIEFGSDGDLAYVVNRDPPSLQIVDTSLDATGFPENVVIGAVEICRAASILSIGDLGDGTMAYVSCFGDSQVWAIDTEREIIDGLINVGRGAHSSAVSPSRERLYVSNFLEDTISVIDIEPGSRTENRVILQLGRERQSGGE